MTGRSASPRARGIAATLGLIAAVLSVSAAHAEPVEYLPVSHWAYDDLAALWTRGVLDSLNLAVKPWSRIEIARSLMHASDLPGVSADPVFRRLEREFARELGWLDHDGPGETAPLLRLAEGDSELRLSVGVDGSARGVPPSKMQLAPGSGGFLRAKAYLRPNLFVVGELRAQRTGSDREIGDSIVKNEDVYLDAGESYVSFAPRHFEALFGLTETRWGPGTGGTLLLGDAADPFPTLRFRLRLGGRFQFDALHATLVQSDNHYLAAHRLTFRVSSSLSLGLGESARYDASSPEMLYLLNLLPYTVVERYSLKNREHPPAIDQRNNVMYGLDAVWRAGRRLRLSAELLLDDVTTESSDMPHRLGWQLATVVYPTLRGAPAELLFEYTKVFRYTYAVYYDRNHIFAGKPLGFERAPDVETYALRAKVDPASDWSFVLLVELERAGEGFLGEFWDPDEPMDPWSGLSLSGVVESTVRLLPSVAWIPRDDVRLEAGLGLHSVRNPHHEEGSTVHEAEAFVSVQWRK